MGRGSCEGGGRLGARPLALAGSPPQQDQVAMGGSWERVSGGKTVYSISPASSHHQCPPPRGYWTDGTSQQLVMRRLLLIAEECSALPQAETTNKDPAAAEQAANGFSVKMGLCSSRLLPLYTSQIVNTRTTLPSVAVSWWL